jgi:hypothetical protein
MGLFTYDVTLEHIASPADDDPGSLASELQTFSGVLYENEFEEHPHLMK